MELIKVGTKIKFTKEDRDALSKVKNIISDIWNEMHDYDYLLNYSEDEIKDAYYMLEAITEAEDDELTILEG